MSGRNFIPRKLYVGGCKNNGKGCVFQRQTMWETWNLAMILVSVMLHPSLASAPWASHTVLVRWGALPAVPLGSDRCPVRSVGCSMALGLSGRGTTAAPGPANDEEVHAGPTRHNDRGICVKALNHQLVQTHVRLPVCLKMLFLFFVLCFLIRDVGRPHSPPPSPGQPQHGFRWLVVGIMASTSCRTWGAAQSDTQSSLFQ